MDWKQRHHEAFKAARHACGYDSPVRFVTQIIVTIFGVAALWLYAGPNDAWSEILVKSGATAAVICILPFFYLWNLLRLGSVVRRNSAVLLIVLGSVLALIGVTAVTLGIMQAIRPSSDPNLADIKTRLDQVALLAEKAPAQDPRISNALSELEKLTNEIAAIKSRPQVEKVDEAQTVGFKLRRAEAFLDSARETKRGIQRLAKSLGIDPWSAHGAQVNPPPPPPDPTPNAMANFQYNQNLMIGRSEGRQRFEVETKNLEKLYQDWFGKSVSLFAIPTDFDPNSPAPEESQMRFAEGDPERHQFRLLRKRIEQIRTAMQELESSIEAQVKRLTEQIRTTKVPS